MADSSAAAVEVSAAPSMGPNDLSINSSHSNQGMPPSSPHRKSTSPQKLAVSAAPMPSSPKRPKSTQQIAPTTPQQLSPKTASPIVLSATSPIVLSSKSPIVLNTKSPPQAENTNPAALPSVPLIDDSDDSGIALGLEQLERQQEEAERRRQKLQSSGTSSNSGSNKNMGGNNNNASNNSNSSMNPQVLSNPPPMLSLRPAPVPQAVVEQYMEDDENSTEMSSTVTGTTGENARGGSSVVEDEESIPPTNNKIGQIIKSAKKRLSSSELIRRRDDDEEPVEEEEDEVVDDSLISGHLQKLGRNGKWQTRWFETDGECLSYYKTSKRTKLLATLDLAKVGSIVVNDEDTKECTFTIQVLGRPYYLRASSKASCKDWVITLNRVKEARLEQGNIKLIAPPTQYQPPDLLDENVSEYTPRVVAIANRQRTRAVNDVTLEALEFPKADNAETDPDLIDHDGSISSISQAVLAQWQKRRSKFSRLAQKLARWARSLKKYNCADVEHQVKLDEHVHPPGHDDKRFSGIAPEGGHQNDAGLSAWIDQEISHPGRHAAVDEVQPIDSKTSDSVVHISSGSVSREEEEIETRYLS